MTDFKKAIDCIKKNDIESLKKLIEERPSILNDRDKHYNRLIHIATLENKIDIVRLLIDLGADIDSIGRNN